MQIGLHHFYKRKRKLAVQTNMHPWIKIMDKLIYVIATVGPLLTLIQAYKIWYLRDADGVSLIAWAGYCIFSIFWIIYGKIHKEKVIIFTNSLSFIVNSLVVTGALLYG